jgi:hypothetical protein
MIKYKIPFLFRCFDKLSNRKNGYENFLKTTDVTSLLRRQESSPKIIKVKMPNGILSFCAGYRITQYALRRMLYGMTIFKLNQRNHTMNSVIEKGSKTAKDGFKNEVS